MMKVPGTEYRVIILYVVLLSTFPRSFSFQGLVVG